MSIDAMKQALELLESAHVATDLVWKRYDCITALRAAIEQAQPDELMIWKSRAMSAERIIEKFMQPEPAPGYCKHCKQYSIEEPLPSQTEQKPVAWMHPSWIDPDTRGWSNDSFSAIPIEGWVPVYTTPRQWQAQKPVFELGFGWLDDATKYPIGTKLYATPPRQWQVQEPVAWYCKEGLKRGVSLIQESPEWEPLYTAPTQRKPLSDDEADELVRRFARYELIRAIEAAHGIKGGA